MLLVGGAGTGKSEVISRRLAHLAELGTGPEEILVFSSTTAGARHLKERAEELLPGSSQQPWIGTWATLGERLLREYASEAGLDPFFVVVGRAERLAIMLDRLGELPMRLHEIRGNPAGVLARLLEKIDTLKAEAISPEALAAHAQAEVRNATDEGSRIAARREREFAEIYAAHNRILAQAGILDTGGVTLFLRRMLAERLDTRAEITGRFPYVMVDELEDASVAQWSLLCELTAGSHNLFGALDDDQAQQGRGATVAGRFEQLHPGAERIMLGTSLRGGAEITDAANAVVAGLSLRIEKPGLAHEGQSPVRFWHCDNERAEAQAAAREIEQLVAGGADPAEICVIVEEPSRQGTMVGAALEERSVPFRLTGPAALFQRPEVRDVVAWLRVIANPDDSAAATRALTRPPTQLRSVDLARLTVIARRRKLNMVSACEAGLESPQIQPEARERIQGFLRLHRAASGSLEKHRADVFVRRLIERIGLRRQRLFAAQPEVAERLLSLSRLAGIASTWTRREPQGSTRDFIRYLSAVADSGAEMGIEDEAPAGGAVQVIALKAAKGLEFRHVYILGLDGRPSGRMQRSEEPPSALLLDPPAVDAETAAAEHQRRTLFTAMTRARDGLVLSWTGRSGGGAVPRSPMYEDARTALGAEEEIHEEELFGPAESLHATYRILRDEVLEASWRAGGELSEPRLDTAIDINRAVARYLELLKLAALAQRREDEKASDSIAAINGLLKQVATPDQLIELETSSLDEYLLDEERERGRRRELIAARQEPSLEAFLPKRGEGLKLSATDLSLYLTCPLKYKFARVFGIPQEPTINQRFGILIHQVLDRFHREADQHADDPEGGLSRLIGLFESGWRRGGFGTTDDELQYRDRARQAMRLYWEVEQASEGEPVWLERQFDFQIGPHHLRGRVDRVDRMPGGDYELIDYKTGERKSEADLQEDLQLALYRLAAREAWDIEAASGSYYYVLDADKVAVEASPDDAERVERTVLQVGEGVMSQDFEPRPSPAVCSWCDYRLICPAAES